MTPNLRTVTTPEPLAPGRYRWPVPEGWLQGRGVFGGLVTAATIRAAEHFLGEARRPLRSLTAHLCGPTLPGEALLEVSTLRIGSNIATVVVQLSQAGEVKSHAVLLFAADRSRDCDGSDLEAPTLDAWRSLEPAPVEPPLAPMFAQHFEFRILEGYPFSGEARPRATGWLRPKVRWGSWDTADVSAFIDAWWPVALNGVESPRPVGTVTYTLELTGDVEGLDPEGAVFHSARQVAGRDGYLVEFRELRGEDGRLLALNQQTIALIR